MPPVVYKGRPPTIDSLTYRDKLDNNIQIVHPARKGHGGHSAFPEELSSATGEYLSSVVRCGQPRCAGCV